MIYAARALLVDPRTWIEDGGLLVVGGVVRRVLRSRRAVLRLRAEKKRLVDLDELVLTPGLVNAHAHLDLGSLHRRVSGQRGFVAWIRALVRARARLTRQDLEEGVRSGARALLASGTTAVGDIDASGTSTGMAKELGLRFVVYRELLDGWDSTRTPAALAGVRRRLRGSVRVQEGLSPHAPYTTSKALLRGARSMATRAALPVSVHWSETREELDWLEAGRGPLSGLLASSPRCSGLSLLDGAGLLDSRTSLVHGNYPRLGEPALLARRGVSLVHCPGTHDFFARSRFPFGLYRSAGVHLALGTDSLASNVALDLRREMGLFRKAFPGVDPSEVFAMATEGGARALGQPRLGHLRVGAAADLVAWMLEGRTSAAALDELTGAQPPVEHVFVAGRSLAGRLP